MPHRTSLMRARVALPLIVMLGSALLGGCRGTSLAQHRATAFDVVASPMRAADPCAGFAPLLATVAPTSGEAAAADANPCFMEQGVGVTVLAGRTLAVNGHVRCENRGKASTAFVSGTLSISEARLDDGRHVGRVNGGAITVNLGSLGVLTYTVMPDPANLVETGPDGRGTLTALFARTHSDEAWNALLPGLVRHRLPITRSDDGELVVQGTNPDGVTLLAAGTGATTDDRAPDLAVASGRSVR